MNKYEGVENDDDETDADRPSSVQWGSSPTLPSRKAERTLQKLVNLRAATLEQEVEDPLRARLPYCGQSQTLMVLYDVRSRLPTSKVAYKVCPKTTHAPPPLK